MTVWIPESERRSFWKLTPAAPIKLAALAALAAPKPKFRPVQWNQLPKMVRVAATRAYFYLDHNIRPRVEKYDDGKYYWCHATDTWWMLVTR